MLDKLRQNLTAVQTDIDAACADVGRAPSDVTLVCVTKYARLEWVRGLYELGQHNFGESRPQQLAERASLFADDVVWHLIGSLQANKVRTAIEHAAVIHSVDSAKLLERIDRIAGEESVRPDLFLQVNVSGEDAKHGWSVDSFREEAGGLGRPTNTNVVGLMTMAPLVDTPEEARPYFAALRKLRDDVMPSGQSLSMGMSGDFAEAIREGATHVRVGSRLFEGLGT